MKINIVSIPVKDQAKAKAFYVEKLGFSVVNEAPMGPGQTWVQLEPPGGGVNLTLVTWFEDMPAGSQKGLVFVVDDLEADMATLRERGLELGVVDESPWGRMLTLHDIDGNALVLHQP